MSNEIILANEVFRIEYTHEMNWQKEMKQFVFEENSTMNNCDIVFEVYGVDTLPEVGGEKIWSNQSCEVFVANGVEIRRFREVQTQKIYALAFQYTENSSIVLALSDWERKYCGSQCMLNLFSLEKHLVNRKKLIFHTCYVLYKGEAILFTAPSGTGKSTQGELWRQHKDADVINGDRCIIGKEGGKWKAFGLPFSGTSNICKNVTTPIKAIVYLQQAPKDAIWKLDKREATKKIWTQLTVNQWNENFVSRAWETMEKIIEEVPIYYFECTKEKSAVDCLYNELFMEETHGFN